MFETVEEFEAAIVAKSNVYVGGAIGAEFFASISNVFMDTIALFLKEAWRTHAGLENISWYESRN